MPTLQLTCRPDQLLTLFGLSRQPVLPADGEFRPGDAIAVVRVAPLAAGRELVRMNWGLIPFWCGGSASAYPEAPSESVASVPVFRAAFRRRRCLIPADCFLVTSAGSALRPRSLRRRDGAPLALAGLWDRWQPPGGEAVETCCVILRAGAVEPAVIEPSDFGRWLDPAASTEHLLTLLARAPVGTLEEVASGIEPSQRRGDNPEWRVRMS